MQKDQPDMEVRLAATQALYNALEFASTNFANAAERNYLMQVSLKPLRTYGFCALASTWACTGCPMHTRMACEECNGAH